MSIESEESTWDLCTPVISIVVPDMYLDTDIIIVQFKPCGRVPWVSWTELLAGSAALASQSRPFPSESKPPLAAVSAEASSSLRPREARIQSGVVASVISCKQSRGSNSGGSGSSNGIKDLIGS